MPGFAVAGRFRQVYWLTQKRRGDIVAENLAHNPRLQRTLAARSPLSRRRWDRAGKATVLRVLTAAAVFAGYVSSSVASDPFSDRFKTLPSCKGSPASTPSSWQRKNIGRSFSLSFPSCFEPVQEPERRYVHGGTRWQCGATTVEVVWGMWGPDSFGEGRERCKTKVAGRWVLVARGRDDQGPSVVVWYPTGEVHEPIVSVWSSNAQDRDLITTIGFSGRIQVPK